MTYSIISSWSLTGDDGVGEDDVDDDEDDDDDDDIVLQ